MNMVDVRILGRALIGGIVLFAMAACSAGQKDGNAVENETTQDAQGNGAGAVGDGVAQHLAKTRIVIRHHEGGGDTRLSAELALTREEKERGLMHRTDLRKGDAMLFPMLPPKDVSFWMKGTPFALDLVFIGPDGNVVKVIEKAKPNDPTPLFADEPVAAVLELRGGDAKMFRIDVKDQISWGACTETPGRKAALDVSFCR